MGRPNVAIVVLHYGRVSLTRRVVEQLCESDPEYAPHIFVLDNAAPEPYPRPWLRTANNLYWAGAFQYAMQMLSLEGYTHCWFLNNDIFFASTPPFIHRAVGRLGRLEKTIGPVGVYAPSVLTNPYHPQMVQDTAQQYRKVAYVDGIAPLLAVDCWKQLGGIDVGKNPYGYGVDIWLSLSASRAGWHVVVDHQVAVKHVYHSTARKITGFMDMAARAEALYLSERLGAEYRKIIDNLQVQYKDETIL